MRTHKEVFRGLSAVCAVLLIVLCFANPLATAYAGRINTVLGTSTYEVVQNSDGTEDLNYFKSDYGTDIYDEAALAQLEADAAADSIAQQEEGSVLLKNENHALPLAEGSKITLFGQNSVNPFYSYHSLTNSMQTLVTYVDSMKAVYDVNPDTLTAYENSGYTRVKSVTDPVIGEAPVSLYTDALKASWRNDYNDAAVVMITRQASEDCDMVMETSEGISQLALSQDERDMMAMLQSEKAAGVFDKIIVLVNSNSAIELGWLDEYDVDACLWVGTPGIVGFTGVANILTGQVSPSGKLVDTYAADSLSAPTYVNAGTNTYEWVNLDKVTAYCSDDAKYVSYYMTYAEGIYVGYKYFETRYEDAILGQGNAVSAVGSTTGTAWNYADEVVYPFGYGLSYTSFDQVLDSVSYDAASDTYTVQVTVTNTGSVAGRSVVEVYGQTPYGEYEKENLVEKASVNMVGYGKTAELAPGASETVTVTIDRYLLASYDSYGVKGYILSAGDYYLAIGNDSHDALNNILAAKGASGMYDHAGNASAGNAEKAYHWNQAELDSESYRYSDETGNEITNVYDNADVNYWIKDAVTYLSRNDWEGTYPVPVALVATEAMMKELDNQSYAKPTGDAALSVSDFNQGVDAGLMFIDMREVDYDDPLWETFLDQLTIEEMASILPDQNGSVALASIGKPASYRGDDMDCLEQVSFKANSKSGVVWPSAVVLACTWSPERVQTRSELTGNETIFMGVTEIWSGGPNLHRNQFNGRTNAYYSEDANMSYLIGITMTESVQKYGTILGYKHIVLNEQELHRESIATFANEQTIREIYMRAFEGAYAKADCLGVMTAFNRVGLTQAGSSYATLTQVMRNEWGFEGVVCSDAVVGMNYKTHYKENLAAGMDYWCWDMAGFGGPPGGGGGAPSGEPSGEASAEMATPVVEVEETAADTGNSGTYSAGGTSDTVISTWIIEQDDGNLLQHLRRAVKNQCYAELRTNYINGLDSNTTIVEVTPWWQTALSIATYTAAVLTVALAAVYLFLLFAPDKAKSKNEQNS